MKEGYRYKNVKKIISVSIVYWKLLDKNYVARGIMRFEDLEGVEIMDMERAKDIFAEYYLIQPVVFDDDIQTRLDEWVYMFKYSKVKGKIKATNMDKVQNKFDIMRMTEEEKKIYDRYQLDKTIYEGELRVKMEEGIEKGRQKVIAAMRKSGMSEEDIKRITDNIQE